MAVETANTIADLNEAWPLGGDDKSEGDNHIRAIKNVLKTTFPGADDAGFNTPILATEEELNYLPGLRSNLQVQIDSRAPKASPAFTGVPIAPTASAGTTTQQIANCSFVQTEINNKIEENLGLPKFFLRALPNGAISASDNISSITDLGVGKIQVNIANDFVSVRYAIVTGSEIDPNETPPLTIATINNSAGQFTGYSLVPAIGPSGLTLIWEFTDPAVWYFAGFGELA